MSNLLRPIPRDMQWYWKQLRIWGIPEELYTIRDYFHDEHLAHRMTFVFTDHDIYNWIDPKYFLQPFSGWAFDCEYRYDNDEKIMNYLRKFGAFYRSYEYVRKNEEIERLLARGFGNHG